MMTVADQIPDSAKLLACPFCNLSTARVIEPANGTTPYVMCTNCTGAGPQLRRDEAIAAWNNRAAPPAMDREALDLDWRLVAKLAGDHGVRYRTNRAFEQFVTAILSTLSADAIRQGEGKIPADIAEHVRKIGKVEWGQTPAHDADGHGRHVADSVRLTAAHFGQTEDQHMHGLWLEGTETVLCHTGTSPNAPMTTQALVGAWNWLVDQVAATPASHASDGGEA